MSVKFEDPVSRKEDEGTAHEHIKTEHPAFAAISISRVQGGTYLYGSDFHHRDYVCIRVHKSYVDWHLSQEWTHSEVNPIIEIAMSEAQFAAMITTMNRGDGTPCTLQSIQGKSVTQIKSVPSKIDKFREDGRESAQDTLNMLTEITEQIRNSKLTLKEKEDLTRKLYIIRERTLSNLKFVLRQFGEHMESTVQKARTEIAAYTRNMLIKAGLEKLTGKTNLIEYEDTKK